MLAILLVFAAIFDGCWRIRKGKKDYLISDEGIGKSIIGIRGMGKDIIGIKGTGKGLIEIRDIARSVMVVGDISNGEIGENDIWVHMIE